MRNVNRWGLAVGAAGALAFAGTAWAQPQTGTGASQDPARTQEKQPGERSGWSGQETNRAGTTGENRETARSSTAGATAGQQDRKVDKGLQERLEKIHAANQTELHMAGMGAQQAQSSEVKQYAETLRKDHQRMDQELQQSAQQMGVQLEGKAFQKKQDDAMKDMKKLEKKTGQDFDKEFMSRMVKDHKSDLKEVQKAAKDARKQNHAELASMLDQAAAGIQGHLDQAKQIEDSLEKSGKAQGRRGQTGAERSGATGPGSAGPGSMRDSGATPSGSGSTAPGAPGAGSTGSGSSADQGSSAQPQGSASDAEKQGSGGGKY